MGNIIFQEGHINMASNKTVSKGNISIKTIEKENLPILFTLFQYVNPDEMIKANAKMISEGKIRIYGLFADSNVIGELRVKFSDLDSEVAHKGKRAYFYAMRILQDYRRKGLGQFLLEFVIAQLEGEGYSEFTIGVEENNVPALNLYSKLGFNRNLKSVCETYQGDTYEYYLLLRKDPNGGVLNAD